MPYATEPVRIIDFRRPDGGAVHAVDWEDDRTICDGHDARDWPTVPMPDGDDLIVCSRSCHRGVDWVLAGSRTVHRPTAWLVVPRFGRRGGGTRSHLSFDGGESTLCRVEGSQPSYRRRRGFKVLLDGERRPVEDLDPTCENCRSLWADGRIR